jgi:hypothetical protein
MSDDIDFAEYRAKIPTRHRAAVFAALDPVLEAEPAEEWTLIRVRSDALQDLMLAYQLMRLTER